MPAPTPAKPAEASRLPLGLEVDFYGTLFPFLEYVGTSGATPANFTGGASQVTFYPGINSPPRFRMTPNTSNLGFRGKLPLYSQLGLIWQIESAIPIDGEGPNTFASRNSHIGFTGDWGTLIWGNWDTPWKWATLVTINPIPGSFVADYTSILSTPGFGVNSVNTTSLLQGDLSRAPFYRREPNSIQYWSPTLAGFSLRLAATTSENRPSPAEVPERPKPYLLSGYLGFDGFGLRVRYAYELHKDFFGMYQLGALTSDAAKTSTDQGHQLTVQYLLKLGNDVSTRAVGTGETLSYKSEDPVVGAFDAYSRPAYYGLLEQKVFSHHVWVAYGQSMSGKCHRVGGALCTTKGLGAKQMSLGYMYAINPNLDLLLVGYRIINDVSSTHSTFPPLLPTAPGLDTNGVGLGIFYTFGVGLGR